jgi:hypothetical protein
MGEAHSLPTACHGPQLYGYLPPQTDWATPTPLARIQRYMFISIKGFMVDVEVWAIVT